MNAAAALLKEREFLYEAALYPEIEYAFKHPLAEQVAYESQLRERRARSHAAVARAIEDVERGLLIDGGAGPYTSQVLARLIGGPDPLRPEIIRADAELVAHVPLRGIVAGTG